jgi:hypothetical protein
LKLLNSNFSSAFKSLTAELTAVKNEQVALSANFDTFKSRLESLEKCSNTPVTTNFEVIDEV